MSDKPAADAGSIYEPHPMFTFQWDPDRPAVSKRTHNGTSNGHGRSFDLGPHPADPMASHVSPTTIDGQYKGPHAQKRSVPGQEIYVYVGNGGYVCLLVVSAIAVIHDCSLA